MSETVTVRRGGSYLTIPALAVERYIARGYDVVDDKGNVIQSSVPNDVTILKRAYEEHVAEIKKLKEEIAQLKSEKIAEPVKHSKLFGTEVEEPEEVVVEKKATSKKTKKSV